jgi:hypothetical protein
MKFGFAALTAMLLSRALAQAADAQLPSGAALHTNRYVGYAEPAHGTERSEITIGRDRSIAST